MRGKRKPEDTDVATEETGPDSSKKRLRVATTHRTAKARKESELRQVLKSIRALLVPSGSELYIATAELFNNVSAPRFRRFLDRLSDVLTRVQGPVPAGMSFTYSEEDSVEAVLNSLFRSCVASLAQHGGEFPGINKTAAAQGANVCIRAAQSQGGAGAGAAISTGSVGAGAGARTKKSTKAASETAHSSKQEEFCSAVPVELPKERWAKLQQDIDSNTSNTHGGAGDGDKSFPYASLFARRYLDVSRRQYKFRTEANVQTESGSGVGPDQTLELARAMRDAIRRPGSITDQLREAWTAAIAAEQAVRDQIKLRAQENAGKPRVRRGRASMSSRGCEGTSVSGVETGTTRSGVQTQSPETEDPGSAPATARSRGNVRARPATVGGGEVELQQQQQQWGNVKPAADPAHMHATAAPPLQAQVQWMQAPPQARAQPEDDDENVLMNGLIDPRLHLDDYQLDFALGDPEGMNFGSNFGLQGSNKG